MNTSNPENILILGKGYIGNALHNHLKCDIKSSKELDYHDPILLRKYLLNNDIKFVINCSGFTGRPNIDEAEVKKELCWELNTQSPLRVNKICNELDVIYIHISSGCIYEGYHQEFTENDTPNFGLFQNHSSFYSKSKHAFELLSKDMRNIILRIRMPMGHDISHKNYLTKIRNYNKLIDYTNSKTYIPDLCEVVKNICCGKTRFNGSQIFNVVNPNPLRTSEVCDIMRKYGFENSNWQFVPISDIEIATGRSNCVMNCDKVVTIRQMHTETEALEKIFQDKLERIKNRE